METYWMKRVSFTSNHMVFGITRVTNQPADQPDIKVLI